MGEVVSGRGRRMSCGLRDELAPRQTIHGADGECRVKSFAEKGWGCLCCSKQFGWDGTGGYGGVERCYIHGLGEVWMSYIVHVTVVKVLDVNSTCNKMPAVIGLTLGTRSWCCPPESSNELDGVVGAAGWSDERESLLDASRFDRWPSCVRCCI